MNLAFFILNTDEIHSRIITTDFVHIIFCCERLLLFIFKFVLQSYDLRS